jgi:two-component system KDP operon response regulator KdpE
MSAAILVVEDEPAIQELIAVNLARHGHEVRRAASADEALKAVADNLPDVILLDWMLPDASGPTLARRLRAEARTKEVPIIMLTARAGDEDKVAGLEAGADDYVTKPFGSRELLARVRAALRRAVRTAGPPEPLQIGRLTVDLSQRQATDADGPVHLTPLEYRVLECLVRARGLIVTRDRLVGEVWGPGRVGDTRNLRVYVKQLRQKLEPDPERPRILVTEAGVGYRLEVD